MLKQLDDSVNVEGQISLDDFWQQGSPGELFAVSRIFAEARKQMTLAEYKAFTYALTNVKWKEECADTLYLDKKEVARAVGIHSDTDHLSQDLYHAIGEMPFHSRIKFADRHKGLYMNGNFVRTIAMFRNVVRIKLETEYLSLFGNLDTNYITMWSGDIYQMRTERSVKFYELLRDNTDDRKSINSAELGIKAMKELFDIPKDGSGSYMRKDGHFDRPAFERYVIDPICEDLAKTQMIQLVVQNDGKYYTKIKRGNRVEGYHFDWYFTDRPRIASAPEMAEIRTEIEKNPEILKVSKDIIDGKRKKQTRQQGQRNFSSERQYTDQDMIDLERRLLQKQFEFEFESLVNSK